MTHPQRGALRLDRVPQRWQRRRMTRSVFPLRGRAIGRVTSGVSVKKKANPKIRCQPPEQDPGPMEDSRGDVECEAMEQQVSENVDVEPLSEQMSPPVKQKVLILSATNPALMRPVPYPTWFGGRSNMIMAFLIVLSIRFGRWSSEQKQLDRFGTQSTLTIDGLLGANRELALRRKAFEERRVSMIEQETRQRLEQAEQRVKQEAAEKLEREKKYKEEHEKEIKRLQILRQKQKEEFEEQEQVMQTELEKRMEIERQIQAEMEAKRRAEEERLRQIEAEKEQWERERQAAAEAERQRQLEKEKQRKQNEKEALNQLRTMFAVRVEGDVIVKRSDSGVVTAGPLSQEAVCSISISMKTSLAAEGIQMEDHYASVEDARDATGKLIGFVCRGVMDQYASSARLQSMTGSGPLSQMDDIELDLFVRYACLSTHHEIAKAVDLLLDEFQSKPAILSHNQSIQIRTEWGVLPKDHEKRLDMKLMSVLQKISNKQTLSSEARGCIAEFLESEMEDLEKGYKQAERACLLAHVFDRSLKTNDSDIYDASVPILQSILEEVSTSAPLDSLLPQSMALSAALGEEHPVGIWFANLAQQNMSPQKKAESAEKKRRLDAALKARVLEQEWPDRQQISAELLKEREESTPIPERVWAFRNVARTLVMSGTPSESALNQSVDLLKKALRLQQKHLGSPEHPGMLGPLRDYAQVLDKVDTSVSVVIWEQIVNILQEMTERYRKQGDLFSAALCAETGLRQGENTLDARHPSMKKLGKESEALFDVLNSKEKNRFLEIRRWKNGMDLIVNSFTSQLGAYRTAGELDRIEAWTQNQPLDPL